MFYSFRVKTSRGYLVESMEDDKNRLQHYLQCRGEAIPRYKRVRVGGKDHTPLWSSSVRINSGLAFQGELSSSKREADFSAARHALEKLKQAERNNNRKPVLVREIQLPGQSFSQEQSDSGEEERKERRILLVDVENLPNFIHTLYNEYRHLVVSNVTVHAFLGEHNPLSQKEYPPGVIIHRVPGIHRDGVDCCITVFVGFLLAQGEYDLYLIATRDKFAMALCEMIKAPNLAWRNKRALIVSQPSHVNKL